MSDTPRTDASLKATQGMFRAASGTNGFTAFARELERENNQLRAQLAEAMKDTERLDWLDAVNHATNEYNETTYGWRYEINHNRSSLSDCWLPALTIRQAIDAARSATP